MSKETKEAKKAAKAEKKAAKGEKNPEIVKSVISAVTAVACVASIIVTSLSITDKVCKTNEDIAAKAGTAGGSSAVSTDTGAVADDTATADDFAADDTTATDDFGTDDATAADDSSSDDTAATVDTGSSSSSSSSSSTSSGTKTPAKEDGAPVGSDVAKVVAYYNKVANATKAYKGKMVIKGKQGANTKITETSFPDIAIKVANGMLPNDYSDAKKNGRNYTVTNGVASDGTPIAKILPIPDDAKMSKLDPSGVLTASCTKAGNGYNIDIKLKPESTTSFEEQPKHHKSCMDCLNMTSKDLEPFTCQNCKIGYPGGTIKATVNDKGLLTSFVVYNPYHITGTLNFKNLFDGTAVIDASWRQELTIAY